MDPYLPGTFWDIDGTHWLIDLAGHWTRVNGPVGVIPAVVPDTTSAVRLELKEAP